MKTPVILIVDDEDSIIDTLKGSLEDEGYIVITSSDGIKAMEIIKSQPVDMVFLDIWLPEMDGLTTLRAIKDFNSAIEVVMMTGHGSVNTAVLACLSSDDLRNALKNWIHIKLSYLLKDGGQHVTLLHLQEEISHVNRNSMQR